MTIKGIGPEDKSQPLKGEKITKKQPAPQQKTGKAGTAGDDDTVKLSGKAKELSGLMKEIEKLPDDREEKIKKLKSAIEDGTYSVDPKKVAGKIIDEVV
jgi:negative regulator of flagellin synthesis FlgM